MLNFYCEYSIAFLGVHWSSNTLRSHLVDNKHEMEVNLLMTETCYKDGKYAVHLVTAQESSTIKCKPLPPSQKKKKLLKKVPVWLAANSITCHWFPFQPPNFQHWQHHFLHLAHQLNRVNTYWLDRVASDFQYHVCQWAYNFASQELPE